MSHGHVQRNIDVFAEGSPCFLRFFCNKKRDLAIALVVYVTE